MIIAVDFDGTCVDHRFPDVGKDAPGAVAVLKALVARGDKLILWTMRCDGRAETLDAKHRSDKQDYLSDAVKWFSHRGIPLWGIQRNPEQDGWTSSPKAYAHVYIDDAALGCPMVEPASFKRPCVDWEAVAEILKVEPFLHVEKGNPWGSEDKIIFLNGKDKPSFRCPCGGNVFRKHTEKLEYRCNSCGSIFEGEK